MADAGASATIDEGFSKLRFLVANPATLSNMAYKQFREHLLLGGLLPGQQFTIRSVSSVLGVSPTPVRDALSRLVAEGALVGTPRYYAVPDLTLAQIDEIYRIRLALEPTLAARAVGYCRPDDIRELREIQTKLTESSNNADYKATLRHNKAFHFKIYNLAGMEITFSLVESLWVRNGPSLNLLYPEFGKSRQGVKNHGDMVSALEHGDAKGLEDAVVRDLESALKSISGTMGHLDKCVGAARLGP